MKIQPSLDPTPRTGAPRPARTIGIIVVAALILAVILLALGVIDFGTGIFG